MKKQIVSVVVPAYNAESTLHRSLQAVVDQSYKDIEIIIVDDASTDDTYQRALEFPHPNKQVLRNRHNIGAHATVNRGFRAAKGIYITHLDADDLLPRNSIEHRVQKLVASDADAVSTAETVVYKGRKTLVKPCNSRSEIIDFLRGNKAKTKGINVHTFMFKRSLLAESGYRLENDHRFNADYEFVLRFLLNHKVVFSDESTYTYMRGDGVLAANLKKDGWQQSFDAIEQKYLKQFQKQVRASTA